MSSAPDSPPPPLSNASEADALRAQLRHRERQIEAIRAISETLFSHDSVEAMLRQTLLTAIATLKASAGAVQLYDAARDALVVRCVIGPAPDDALQNWHGHATPTSQGIAGRVFRSAKPDIALDALAHPDFNHAANERANFLVRAVATVPLKRRGQAPMGVLQLFNFEALYDSYDLETLEVIASQAAVAIDDFEREQQAQKAAIVGFIGDLSHDIKNMLTPVQTGLWTLDPMLRQMFDDLEKVGQTLAPAPRAAMESATQIAREEYEWMLQNALDAAARVRNRTKEIADAVKGVSTPPRFETADFNETCRETIAALRLVAHDAQVELQLDLDQTLLPVQFDRKQMDTALYNLINNAIPETPEEGTITLRTRAADGECFVVQIADTGRGMPPAVRDKLFTDEAVSTKPGGTGLGTRIVADIVRRHRGTISVQSAPGAGTTFTLRLPIQQG